MHPVAKFVLEILAISVPTVVVGKLLGIEAWSWELFALVGICWWWFVVARSFKYHD